MSNPLSRLNDDLSAKSSLSTFGRLASLVSTRGARFEAVPFRIPLFALVKRQDQVDTVILKQVELREQQ
ncbi:hypothetical protein BGZ73_000538, partial [Actinomortierella ambigua]